MPFTDQALRALLLTTGLLVVAPRPAFGAYDGCFDSGIGCGSLGAPPVVSSSVPELSTRQDVDREYEPRVPVPDNYQDVERRGIAAEIALEKQRAIRAWRRDREKEADRELATLISDHETEIARLKHAVKTWQSVQKKLPAGKDVHDELEDWAEQSREAEHDAIAASVSLAAGAYAEKAFRATKLVGRSALTLQKLEKELIDIDNEAFALAQKCASNEKLAKALLDVRAAVTQAREHFMSAALGQADAIAKHGFYESMDALLKLAKYAPDERTRQDINLLLAKISAVSYENLTDTTVDFVIDQVMPVTPEDWTIHLRAVKFTGEYGLAAYRFGLAWSHIEDLNEQIADRARLIKMVDQRMKDDLVRKQNLESELVMLKEAKGSKLRDKERVLASFHEFGRARAIAVNDWVLKRTAE